MTKKVTQRCCATAGVFLASNSIFYFADRKLTVIQFEFC